MRFTQLVSQSILGLAVAQRPDESHYTLAVNGRVYNNDEIRVRNLP